jgi:hypothetical protein
MPPTSGKRFATRIERTQLKNSEFEALGSAVMNAWALITRLFSCCIASFRVDAIPVDAVTNAWCDRWASLRATTEAPSIDPVVPAVTSSAAAINQARRERLIGPALSTPVPNGRDVRGNGMNYHEHESLTTLLWKSPK